jgi:hypothetical protein
MAYLRCPDCRLTARASACYVHGDRCPRCLTMMEPVERFRDTSPAKAAILAATEDAAQLGRRAAHRPA